MRGLYSCCSQTSREASGFIMAIRWKALLHKLTGLCSFIIMIKQCTAYINIHIYAYTYKEGCTADHGTISLGYISRF